MAGKSAPKDPAEDAERRRVRKERAALVDLLEIAVRQASAQGARVDSAIAERLSVNSTDLQCLDLLNLRGAVSAGDLAETLNLTTGAVTTVIDRLEKAGYVARVRVQGDRRKVMIALTPDAAPRVAAFFGAMQQELEKMLTDYSDTEIHFLIAFFTRAKEAAQRSVGKLKRRKD
jgi:DNA-binding MarR family transcriptional regulator